MANVEHVHEEEHGHGHAHDQGHGHGHTHDDAHAHSHADGPPHAHAHPSGVLGGLAALFAPHSHDAADSVDDALLGSAAGIHAVKVSLVVLGATAAVQLLVVVLSGSVGLLADTIHNVADASTAIPLWIAFALGRRPANRRYTYGYGRAEDLAGVFVVLMIAGSATLAAWQSVQRLLHPEPIGYLGWVAAAGVVGFVGNELVAQFRIKTGEQIGSAALIADGYHARTDGLTSLAVVLGAAGVWLGIPQADPLVGLVITVAILLVLKDAVLQIWRRLMDAIDPDLVERAEAAARDTAGVQQVSGVRARWIGHEIHAEVLVVADSALTLAAGHAVAEGVRHAMLHAVPKLTSVTVHVDPSQHSGEDPHAALAHHDTAR